jgi:hypothetical protein
MPIPAKTRRERPESGAIHNGRGKKEIWSLPFRTRPPIFSAGNPCNPTPAWPRRDSTFLGSSSFSAAASKHQTHGPLPDGQVVIGEAVVVTDLHVAEFVPQSFEKRRNTSSLSLSYCPTSPLYFLAPDFWSDASLLPSKSSFHFIGILDFFPQQHFFRVSITISRSNAIECGS